MTVEHLENFLALLQMPGFEVLLHCLAQECAGMEQEVVKYDLTNGGDSRKLMALKCRAEGARKLLVNFEARVASLSADKQKSNT